MAPYRHIDIRPVAGALGAEVHGVDISRELADDVVAQIRQAFLDHLVIFFRERPLTPALPTGMAQFSGGRSSRVAHEG